ncbi:MAG: TIGR04283 family arsenosugar biosynthesis glycosyltransferase [Rubrivivax sp.]|jgi:rSAM/selenodomain-associated transferase 2|nr:TIGR04283 family arsenosugar biosynthesis glycosyltransferase [Rubrivivax sp.]MBK7262877.1 TIGR04283 family arsenosugar biosynthesis glycosyltransferase [Rubrivivax sp.]
MQLAIVVPVLDEAAGITAFLQALAPLRARGAELIVVDGGSLDGTPALAAADADQVISAPRGRARQMNAGAAATQAGVLLFLHADTRLPPHADALLLEGLAQGRAAWGRFDVRIEGRSRLLPWVAGLMNHRSRLSGIATGDQAIFMCRRVFDAVGGFPDQPLMEDVEISRRLKRLSRPLCLRHAVTTSGRRWDQRGAWRTIVLMWRLRWQYWRGVAPERLAGLYR